MHWCTLILEVKSKLDANQSSVSHEGDNEECSRRVSGDDGMEVRRAEVRSGRTWKLIVLLTAHAQICPQILLTGGSRPLKRSRSVFDNQQDKTGAVELLAASNTSYGFMLGAELF